MAKKPGTPQRPQVKAGSRAGDSPRRRRIRCLARASAPPPGTVTVPKMLVSPRLLDSGGKVWKLTLVMERESAFRLGA